MLVVPLVSLMAKGIPANGGRTGANVGGTPKFPHEKQLKSWGD